MARRPQTSNGTSGSGRLRKFRTTEPELLQFPLVLQLLRRAGHEFRRALLRYAALVPRPGCRERGDRHGRQVRGEGQPRDPGTLEAYGRCPDRRSIVFSQYNANASGGNPQGSEMELRGTKGTVYLHSNRWEVVPERVTDATFPLAPRWTAIPKNRTALEESGDRAEGRQRQPRHSLPCPQLPRLREEPRRRRTAMR